MGHLDLPEFVGGASSVVTAHDGTPLGFTTINSSCLLPLKNDTQSY